MDQEDLASALRELDSYGPPSFKPEPWYNEAGDCLVWYFRNDESYACRVDDKLTVYRALQNDELVGCLIKGITALAQTSKAFGFEILEQRVRLSLFFVVSAFEAKPEDTGAQQRREIYHDLMRRAGTAEVELVGAG